MHCCVCSNGPAAAAAPQMVGSQPVRGRGKRLCIEAKVGECCGMRLTPLWSACARLCLDFPQRIRIATCNMDKVTATQKLVRSSTCCVQLACDAVGVTHKSMRGSTCCNTLACDAVAATHKFVGGSTCCIILACDAAEATHKSMRGSTCCITLACDAVAATHKFVGGSNCRYPKGGYLGVPTDLNTQNLSKK
jgi:hypothetical protein